MEERPGAVGTDDLPEGEERPPAGVATAGFVRWAIVALVAVAAAGAWVHHAVSSGAYVARDSFRCPMHPTVVQARPGECPICGMDLVAASAHTPAPPASPPAAAPRPASYTCPMHPSISDARPGECPVCGMKLVASAATPPTAAAAGDRFTCPMHPAFTAADPKVRCPECGMKLVPVGPGAGAPDPAVVPGLVPVELSADRIQLMGLRTAPAVREVLASTLRTIGFVTADEGRVASVTTRFAGWVEALPARETGQRVREGQVLVSIYSPEMLGAQQVYLNAIRWTEAQGSAPLPAPTSGVTGPEREARQRLELAGFSPQDMAEIQKTGRPLRAVNVRSPVRGHVASRNVVLGAYVPAGSELFQIADLSTVWILADVYEADAGRVKVGQPATLELDAYPGRRFDGRVEFVYPAVNAGTRTLQARVVLRNPDLDLKPGMYGDVTIEAGAREALVVPGEAVIDLGERQHVFVALGRGRFEPRRVRPGARSGDRVAILEGLAEGEHVVIAAGFLLDSESRLQAALQPPAPAHHEEN